MSSDDAQGWVPATCLEAQDDPDDFSDAGEEGMRCSASVWFFLRVSVCLHDDCCSLLCFPLTFVCT